MSLLLSDIAAFIVPYLESMGVEHRFWWRVKRLRRWRILSRV